MARKKILPSLHDLESIDEEIARLHKHATETKDELEHCLDLAQIDHLLERRLLLMRVA